MSRIISRRKITALALCVLLFAVPFPAKAQQPNKVPRIGFLIASNSSANSARVEAFNQGLRELGYVPGKNIILEYRYADGNLDRLAGLVAELIGLNVDVIVTAGPADTRAAKKATSTIPIVMTFDNDPVGNRFVASLARPGGNITGVSTFAPELSGKQLELLKELIPKLSQVAIIGNSKKLSLIFPASDCSGIRCFQTRRKPRNSITQLLESLICSSTPWKSRMLKCSSLRSKKR